MKLTTYLSALRKCEREYALSEHVHFYERKSWRNSRLADKLEKKIVKIKSEESYWIGVMRQRERVGEMAASFFAKRQSDQITPQTWIEFKSEVLGERDLQSKN